MVDGQKARVGSVVALATASLFLCSACSTVYVDKYPGVTETVHYTPDSAEEELSVGLRPQLYWSDDERTLLLVTWGSSSCPVEPVKVELPEPGVVDVELKAGGFTCTADNAPTTFELAPPAGIKPTVGFDFWVDGEFVREVPALP